MKNYIKSNWILLLIILIAFSMLYSRCKNEKILSSERDILKVKVNTYKLKDGKVVASTKTLVYDKVPQKTELTKQFSKVKTIIKIVERVRIDTVNVVYHDSVPCNFERKGAIISEDYSLDYKSTQKGITIANLTVNDSLEIVAGTKRKWFLGRTTDYVDVSHSNKKIITDEVIHFEIKPKKKFWETTVFKVGIGVLGGALLVK